MSKGLFHKSDAGRNEQLLTMAEVEDAIIDAIECLTDYQDYDYTPISPALGYLAALAASRAKGTAAPGKDWERRSKTEFGGLSEDP